MFFWGSLGTQTKALLPHIPTWDILATKNARLWQIAQLSSFFFLAIPFAAWVATLS
jgi:fucose permease